MGGGLPGDEVGEGEAGAAEVAVEPEAEVVERHLGGEPGLQAGQVVRALLAQGSGAEARRQAELFYESSPGSPQAAVLRSLIANNQMQTAPSRL